MARCAKCGTEIGGFSDLYSHACNPQRELSPLQREALQEERRKQNLRGLDHQIEMANDRDFGPGQSRDDRYASQHDRLKDRTPDVDADGEVPKDHDDRAEFRAKEWRFPREQAAALGQRPWDKGMVIYTLTPEEIAELQRTGRSPEVAQERKEQVRKDEPQVATPTTPVEQKVLDFEAARDAVRGKKSQVANPSADQGLQP